MESQNFMGRNQLIDRLSDQVGNRDMALGILEKRGAQIQTLVGSLKHPGQKTIDFSKIKPKSIKGKEENLLRFS